MSWLCWRICSLMIPMNSKQQTFILYSRDRSVSWLCVSTTRFAASASNGVMQVVLSYLEVQPPDIDSTEAAFEAYFAQPFRAAVNRPLASLSLPILHLQEAICQALHALHSGDSTAFQCLCNQHPAAEAMRALQTAVSIIDTRLKCFSDSANMLATSATAADSGSFQLS